MNHKNFLLLSLILALIVIVQVNDGRAENNISTNVQMISGSNPTFVNQPVKFSVSVSGGTPPYSIQWYIDGSSVSGATQDTFVFVENSSGRYHLSITVFDSKGEGGEPLMMRAVGGIEIVVNEQPTASQTTPVPTPSLSPSVPEFPWLTILPILLTTSIALAIVRKRLQRNV